MLSPAAMLLEEQAAAVAKFQAGVRALIEVMRPLDFPLFSPTPGYDVCDITEMLEAWLYPMEQAWLEQIAYEKTEESV